MNGRSSKAPETNGDERSVDCAIGRLPGLRFKQRDEVVQAYPARFGATVRERMTRWEVELLFGELRHPPVGLE